MGVNKIIKMLPVRDTLTVLMGVFMQFAAIINSSRAGFSYKY